MLGSVKACWMIRDLMKVKQIVPHIQFFRLDFISFNVEKSHIPYVCF